MKPKQFVWQILELALQGDTASIENLINETDDADLERVMHWCGAMPEWQELTNT